MPGILHLVIWAFKPDVSPEDRQKVAQHHSLALRIVARCVALPRSPIRWAISN